MDEEFIGWIADLARLNFDLWCYLKRSFYVSISDIIEELGARIRVLTEVNHIKHNYIQYLEHLI